MNRRAAFVACVGLTLVPRWALGQTPAPPAFSVTGSAPVGPENLGAAVELRSVDCLVNCTIARTELTSDGTYFFWGSTNEIPRNKLLIVAAHLSGALYLSKPFRLGPDQTFEAPLSRLSFSLRIWQSLLGTKSAIAGLQAADAKPTPPPARSYVHSTLYFITDRIQVSNASVFGNDPNPAGTFESGTVVAHVARCAVAPSCDSLVYCQLAGWICDTPAPGATPNASDVYADPPAIDPGSNALESLRRSLEDATGGPAAPKLILVFVHGFNIDFATDVNYGARLSLEAERRPHVTVLYSWPSKHDGQAYATDQERAGFAAQPFAAFLDMLSEVKRDLPEVAVVIVAHSMGAHVVTEGISRWISANAGKAPFPFERVVFFAGDEGKLDWDGPFNPSGTRAAYVLTSTPHLNIVQSSNDAALIASWCVMHDDHRLGQPDAGIVGPANLEVDDDTPVAGWADAGHTYFIERTEVARQFSGWIAGPDALSFADPSVPWLATKTQGLPYPVFGEKLILCPVATKIFSH